ncbi:MAG TPA: tRNA (guanosine(46)-N7)-methyltransferase TrmB [Methylovirgula sp.]|nr:tRNA (guanosine(46)-N7)-methyltransferase TrmB [Methylovirgula sp.]
MSADSGKDDVAGARPAGATRLYGRHKGKKLRAHQAGLLETLLPRLALDLSRPIADATTLFPRKPAAIWLEIGFGGGEHLIARAEANPNCGFIGCEHFENGLAKALALVEAKKLDNIRFYCGDAGAVIDALPDGALKGVYLLYPDPWPKRRQRKRRFLSDDMLAALARVMQSEAQLRFATDIDDNAGWTLARILRSTDFIWDAETAADWQQAWPGWTSTRYETKALATGRKPIYLTFARR